MMASKSTLLLLLLFLCCFCKLHTGNEVQQLSREDLELEKQLKLLNKPSVTTIKTIHGEEYNCVHFYKQPAFDHPALKNHNFHHKMRPSSFTKRKIHEDSPSIFHQSFSNLWQNGKGCPTGTVPIKRITKDDLISAKKAADIYAEKYEPLTIQEPGTHYAILRTNDGKRKKFNGGGMQAIAYNPQPVTGSQYSSSQLKILNGRDSIEAGWTVNPTLYNDTKSHLFLYTNAGATRCFNTHCPGFVIVRADIPIDDTIVPISKPFGKLYGVTIFIQRDPPNGNWWLQYGPNLTQVGFWPKQIFTGLADMATYIEWGGKAYSPPSIPSPPMGGGTTLAKIKIIVKDAFDRYVSTINEASQIVDATDTSTFADIPQYQVIDMGNHNPRYRHYFFFGGYGRYIEK